MAASQNAFRWPDRLDRDVLCLRYSLFWHSMFSVIYYKRLSAHRIVGVNFPKQDIKTLHNMFADDLYMIIRALLCYIYELQRILDIFGLA